MAAALQPVESLEQKAWRWAKYKALRMDLLTTDREETEFTHMHAHACNKYCHREEERVQPKTPLPQDKVMRLQHYIITYTAKNLFAHFFQAIGVDLI